MKLFYKLVKKEKPLIVCQAERFQFPAGQVVAKGRGIVEANNAETASYRMRIVTVSASGMK